MISVKQRVNKHIMYNEFVFALILQFRLLFNQKEINDRTAQESVNTTKKKAPRKTGLFHGMVYLQFFAFCKNSLMIQ